MDKEVRAFFRYLKEKCPTEKPTYLRTRDYKTLDGITHHKKDCNIIYIDKKLDHNQAIDTLVHEYSHALSGFFGEDAHPHSWAVCYGRVYRNYVKFKYSVGDW